MKINTPRLLHDHLLVAAEENPKGIAIIAEDKEYNYDQLLTAASALAQSLKIRGLQLGDRVAIFMDNTWPCVISIYATLLSGGVFIVVNPQTKHDKLEYILNDSAAKFLLTDAHLAFIFNPILSKVNSCQGVICSGEPSQISPDANQPIESFEELSGSSNSSREFATTIPNDLAALIYTSGSTGDSKGVMMTHQSMVFTSGSLVEYLRLSSTDQILSVLPMAFDYGLYQLLMSVRLGATLVLERSFAFPAVILKKMEEYEATVFPGVPTIFQTLVTMHRRKALSFPSVKRITNTAAALSPEIIPSLKEIFPEALIFKMYGLTECKRVCFLEPELLEEKTSSVGKAIPGTEMFLLSLDGEPVQCGESGILHVRGPHVMQGYWNKPELSQSMLREGSIPGEKILCAQDWFSVDEDGFFYFEGRSDDIIKTRGEKVSPIEVENVLHGIEGILEAAVIGQPDELLGEVVVAFVSLDGTCELPERKIIALCSRKLENFRVPKTVHILEELPKTNTGKISKKGLSKLGRKNNAQVSTLS